MSDTMTKQSAHTADDGAENEKASSLATYSARRRKWTLWVGLVAVLAAAGAITFFWVQAGESTVAAETANTTPNTGQVVLTDLVENDVFDGTLGSLLGDPIGSTGQGTLTVLSPVDSILRAGMVAFAIEDDPVVVLDGEGSLWRTLTLGGHLTTVSGRITGTVTAVAAVGDIVEQGDVLYSVDAEPIVILYGDSPAYRPMRDATENLFGADVLQLETALVALGYDPDGTVTVDTEFTALTASMVERWQEDVGMEVDGVVDFGEVIFIPGPGQVTGLSTMVGASAGAGPIATLATGDPVTGTDVEALELGLAALGYDVGLVDTVFDDATRLGVIAWQTDVGASPDGVVDPDDVLFLPAEVRISAHLAAIGTTVNRGQSLMATVDADKVVRIDLPASDQGIMSAGDAVTVEMPDNSRVGGTVLSVATTATGQGQNATFEVIVTLDDPSAAAGLDEAPVEVEVVADSVSGVVAVPVTALIALAEGGYAVELESGQLVAVEPGFFADGLVEVRGNVSPGDVVLLP